jgi:hypothetical protein
MNGRIHHDKVTIGLIAAGLVSGSAIAQTNAGLIGVQITDIEIIKNALNKPDINVAVPVTVQVPVGVAANVCDVQANVLAQQKKDGAAACTAKNSSTAFDKAIVDQVAAQ